jgi:FixJ family two-component response regulator
MGTFGEGYPHPDGVLYAVSQNERAALGSARRPGWGRGAKPVTDQTTAKPVVYVVDDEAVVRSYLVRVLSAASYAVVAFASADELLRDDLPRAPGCLILDVFLPGLGGLDLQAVLSREQSHLPVILITGQGTIPMSVQAMRAGAFDFLPKPIDAQELLGSVRRAIELSARICAEEAESLAVRERIAVLSDRQAEVLRHVAAGKLNKQIAAELGILEKTVKVHRGRGMQKLGVRSVADLARLVDKYGL